MGTAAVDERSPAPALSAEMKTPLLVGPRAMAPELPFALEVSSLARRYVRDHGGQVFLWHKR
jgi:hypothetical protein